MSKLKDSSMDHGREAKGRRLTQLKKTCFIFLAIATALGVGCSTDTLEPTGDELNLESETYLLAVACGDGVLEAGEGCDDGNIIDGDPCNSSCLIRTGNPCNADPAGLLDSASCASGICDSSGGFPGFCQPAPRCGDGTLDAGEGCDDGNLTNGDGCSAGCLVEDGSACNDAAPGNLGASSCLGGMCDTSGGTPGVCGAPPPLCGNSILEAGEGCDDGGLVAGDGCDAACLVEDGSACNASAPGSLGASSCSTGVCDIGGGLPGLCGAPPAMCGNSSLESTEGCDDGNTTAGDGCDASCQLEPGFACTNTAIVGRPIFISTDAVERMDAFTNPANTVDLSLIHI